jgi:hypothetical protein
MKNLEKFCFLKFEMKIFVIWNLEKKWPYHHNEMKKVWIFIFEILNENFHFEIWKESTTPLERNEKTKTFRLCYQENFEIQNWKKQFWILKKMAISTGGNEKIEIKKSYISLMPPRKNYQ